jgi:hypothetical protein
MKKLSIDFTPEVNAKLKAHADKWIKHALSTEPADFEKIKRGVEGCYAAANLKKPRVILVPSPLVMAIAYGCASGIWWMRKNPKQAYVATSAATYDAARYATRGTTSDATDAATYDATRAATYAATDAATDDATYAATYAATDAATRAATLTATSVATQAATYAATDAATDDATYAATHAATSAATYDATDDATDDATRKKISPLAKFFLANAARWSSAYQGGRMWSGWLAYATAFRDLGWLDLKEHEVLKHYEDAAEGGFRVMHEEFCLVCDNPEVLKFDAQNAPHCEDGPSHRWRDGWSLWHIHGVRVTEQIVMHPETLTVKQIDAEENAEVRRVMIDRYGVQKYLHETEAKLLHCDVWHGLPRGLIEDKHGQRYLYGSDNSTGRIYTMPVAETAETCKQAHESICGFNENNIKHQS